MHAIHFWSRHWLSRPHPFSDEKGCNCLRHIQVLQKTSRPNEKLATVNGHTSKICGMMAMTGCLATWNTWDAVPVQMHPIVTVWTSEAQTLSWWLTTASCTVLCSCCRFTMHGTTVILQPGDTIVVPKNTVHSAEVVGKENVVFFDSTR